MVPHLIWHALLDFPKSLIYLRACLKHQSCLNMWPRSMKVGYRQRADRTVGANEVVHNLVCTGHVSWRKGEESQFNQFIFPPTQLEKTNASQISAGILLCVERHLLNGVSFETWLQSMSSGFSKLNVFMIADSASANVKLTWKMSSFLRKKGEQYGVQVLVHYHACWLHQIARIVVSEILISLSNFVFFSVIVGSR